VVDKTMQPSTTTIRIEAIESSLCVIGFGQQAAYTPEPLVGLGRHSIMHGRDDLSVVAARIVLCKAPRRSS
jgi:hypothetical protein